MPRGRIRKRTMWMPPPADVWRNIIDVADAWARGKLDFLKALSKIPSTDIAQVKNSTGSDLERGDVICLDGLLPITELLGERDRWFDGKQPTIFELRYGILLESIPNGVIGPVQISGHCLAKVDKLFDNHTFAHIVAGSSQLETTWHGQAEILDTIEFPDESGEFWAEVRLSNYQSTVIEAKVSELSGIVAGGSGDVEVWIDFARTNPIETLTAHFKWMATGTAEFEEEVLIRYNPLNHRWDIINRKCAQ